jgi:hypothetical protein
VCVCEGESIDCCFVSKDESWKVDEKVKRPIHQHTYTLSLQGPRHINRQRTTKGPLLLLAHPFIRWNHPSIWTPDITSLSRGVICEWVNRGSHTSQNGSMGKSGVETVRSTAFIYPFIPT